jgi:cytochrome b561
MPGVVQNEALAKQLFELHGMLAFMLAALVLCHVAAALVHLLIKRDGVFERMWPKKTK